MIREEGHWQAMERPRREPTEENDRSAKRVFFWLATCHHPNSSDSHEAFL